MKHNIMVCVTGPRTCDKLIARGMERSADAEIHVVHCVETGRNFMGTPFEGDAVEYLFTAAQLAGAELILLLLQMILKLLMLNVIPLSVLVLRQWLV